MEPLGRVCYSVFSHPLGLNSLPFSFRTSFPYILSGLQGEVLCDFAERDRSPQVLPGERGKDQQLAKLFQIGWMG